MAHVAHQTICMQYMLELSKQLDVDPRACIGSFFSRYENKQIIIKNINFNGQAFSQCDNLNVNRLKAYTINIFAHCNKTPVIQHENRMS